VSLSLEIRRIGDITIVTCTGRIVAGEESETLQQAISRALPDEPFVVLNAHAVHYVDSGGAGMLVRLLNRTRTAGGDLKLCQISDRVAEVLRITRLDKVFEVLASESDAIAAFLHHPSSSGQTALVDAEILCVDRSRDLLVYITEVLRQAGWGVMAFDNLPDALSVLKGSRPKVVVIGSELRVSTGTWTADTFHALAKAATVIELPADFSRTDAGESSQRLLEGVRAALGGRGADSSARPPATS
jgi:anti-sigma B factor antagonist